MNAAPSLHPRRASRQVTAPDATPTIFVDLDGTLIWTWSPLITSAFMAQLYGLPISTLPKPKDGYLKLTRVPFEDGKYSLTCHRPNIGRFLRSLRTLGNVCLLTHAPRDYAFRMNSAFSLGFADDQIFTVTEDYQVLSNRFSDQQKLTILLDDEGPGWKLRWLGRPNYEGYDHRADSRHRDKCHCTGVRPESRRDIPYPRFYGRADDLFLRTSFRHSILQRVIKTLQRHRRKGAP